MAKTKVPANPNVGKNIEALMAMSRDLQSQPLLAKRVGLAQSTIGRILRGEVSATGENLKRIADAFDVDVDILFLNHENLLEFRDARLRGKDKRFAGEPDTPSVRVTARARVSESGEFTLEEGIDDGTVIGVTVDDGYAIRVRDVAGKLIRYDQILVVERQGSPSFSDLCIVRLADKTTRLMAYVGVYADHYGLEEIHTKQRLRFPRDGTRIEGVVAIVSNRQSRP